MCSDTLNPQHVNLQLSFYFDVSEHKQETGFVSIFKALFLENI